MEPLQSLSEAVIDILKEFFAKKRQLTPVALEEAFSTSREIVSLLSAEVNGQQNASWQKSILPGMELARVPLGKPETVGKQEVESLSKLRDSMLNILDSLGPVISGDHEKRYGELRKKISDSELLLPLIQLGEQVGTMVGELVDRVSERMDFSNDFLFELSKDLCQMEEQLSSYKDFNREAHQISDEFHNDLLSTTDDIHHAIESGNNRQNIRALIASKLSVISRAIEVKRQSDDDRLRVADAKIAELQNNLVTYEHEIQQVREHSEFLEKEVLLDQLTNINNRRSYDMQIRECLRLYKRNRKPFSLILIDIDHFKKVNDSYGHKAGDKCLKEVVNLVKLSLRQSDFFARYGGEELIAILQECDAVSARNAAEKIRNRVEKAHFYYQNVPIPITVSLGVTEVAPLDKEPEAPFIRVDEALYRAKKDGRNRVHVITEMPQGKISSRENRE
jgi:diguanylate cyclase